MGLPAPGAAGPERNYVIKVKEHDYNFTESDRIVANFAAAGDQGGRQSYCHMCSCMCDRVVVKDAPPKRDGAKEALALVKRPSLGTKPSVPADVRFTVYETPRIHMTSY